MKQKEVSVLDFNAIDWDMVNQEKAAFIHNEILQYNKEQPRRQRNSNKKHAEQPAQVNNVAAGTSLGDLDVLADLKKKMEEGK